MPGMSRARLILVPLLVSACQTWSTVAIPPNASGPLPKHSMVVLMGGERVHVDAGRSTPDSLIGVRLNGVRFAVPRDSVAFLEKRRVSAVRTIGTGVGVWAFVAAAFAGMP